MRIATQLPPSMNFNRHSINLAERQMDIAVAKSEFKRIQLFILSLLIGLAIMLIQFFLVKGTTDFFVKPDTKYYVIGWFVIFITYEVIGFFLARSYLKKKIVLPSYMRIINVTVEALLPTALIFILNYREQTVIFLDTPLIFFYFILISISALNLEYRLSLIVGLVSAAGYFYVTFYATQHFDPEHLLLDFPVNLYYARSPFMLLAALGSTFVAFEIKKRQHVALNMKQKMDDIERLFDQQVSKEVAGLLLNDNFSSHRREVTIMFLDIRNYSQYAETHNPEEVIDFQNKFFSPILRIINQHKGITNQIMGDGLMASFGAPLADEHHAQQAYDASLAIMEKINEKIIQGDLPEIHFGIGLHTGDVVMGNIGNELRRQFSLSGTAVVIAARVEQANKEYNTQMLISKNTREQIDGRGLALISKGEIKMKNLTRCFEVFHVS